jgi:hypothetical protein
LDAAKAIAEENQAYINAKQEAEKNSPFSGLFNLAETNMLTIIVGLLVLATIALIAFGYTRREELAEKFNFGSKEEGGEDLTFLNEKSEAKKLREYDEDEDDEPQKKGKWAI